MHWEAEERENRGRGELVLNHDGFPPLDRGDSDVRLRRQGQEFVGRAPDEKERRDDPIHRPLRPLRSPLSNFEARFLDRLEHESGS